MPGTERVIAFSQLAVKGLSKRNLKTKKRQTLNYTHTQAFHKTFTKQNTQVNTIYQEKNFRFFQ
jgi:hypothetical protein